MLCTDFTFHIISALYCSAVMQIANGYAVSATNVSFGGVAHYRCYSGFAFASGRKEEEVVCSDTGLWTPMPKCRGFCTFWPLLISYFYSTVKILFCLAENCSTLPAFQYGERTLLYGDGIGYGTVYRLFFARISMRMDCLGTVYNYNCSRGFHLEGPPMIMCKRIFYLFFSCPK